MDYSSPVGDPGRSNRLAGGGIKLAAAETVPVPVPAQPKWPSPPVPRSLDQLAESVSIRDGAYLVHFSYGGRSYAWRLEENWIERRHGLDPILNLEVYGTREQATTALTPYVLQYGRAAQGFWQLPGLPLAVPTYFSDRSAPRIMAGIEAKDEDMLRAARAVTEEMKGLAGGMLIGKALGMTYGAARNQGSWLNRRAAEGFEKLTENLARTLNPPSEPQSTPPVYGSPVRPPVTPQPKSAGGTTSGTPPPRSAAASGTLPRAGGQSAATSGTKAPGRGQETSSADPRFRRPPPAAFDPYRTAEGEVIGSTTPTASPISNAVVGRERESLLPAIMQQRFPQTQFRYTFDSGRPDAEWIGGRDPGFDIADLKPMSRPPDHDSYFKFRTQVRRWAAEGWPNRQAPATFRAAMISYTPDGDYFIQDLAGAGGKDYQTPPEKLAKPAKGK